MASFNVSTYACGVQRSLRQSVRLRARERTQAKVVEHRGASPDGARAGGHRGNAVLGERRRAAMERRRGGVRYAIVNVQRNKRNILVGG